jgi:hypothetical protein
MLTFVAGFIVWLASIVTPTPRTVTPPEPQCSGPASESVCSCWAPAATEPPEWVYRCATPWQDPICVERSSPAACPVR